MPRGRAYRRHQYDRMKKKAKRIYQTTSILSDNPEPTSFYLGFTANTRKPCSSWCCGNPRKWFGELTIQERKACST